MSPTRRRRLGITISVAMLTFIVLAGVLSGGGFGGGFGTAPKPSAVPVPVTPAAPVSFVALAGAPLHAPVPLGAGAGVDVVALGSAGVPTTGVSAVLVSITVTSAAAGYVSAFEAGTDGSDAARVNFLVGTSAASRLVVAVSPAGAITIANHSSAGVQVAVGVAGYLRQPGTSAPGASTSRYVRDIDGSAGDGDRLRAQGCADAKANGANDGRLVLLDIGSQTNHAPLAVGRPGVQLSATQVFLDYPSLVKALRGYVAGYSSCRPSGESADIAIGTNNDGYFDTYSAANRGKDWAKLVVDPVRSAAGRGISVEGANDIEVGFTSTEAQAEAWERAYLAATTGRLVFNGSADRCPNSIGTTGQTCLDSVGGNWTQANYFALAHGVSASRIVALPQIYNGDNATQWAAIDQTGAKGNDHIVFLGALTENPICGLGCNFTPAQGFDALRDALSVDPRTRPTSLTTSTNLRVDA